MGRRRKFGRAVDGVVIIDKPSGMTSNDVVQKAKRLFFANKVGHTGALDPLATGVLPLCFGEATKFSQYLLDSDKEYLSTFRFGQATDTGDVDGNILSDQDASGLTRKELEKRISERYMGQIEQVPPMYSALKRDGRPLYELAREGKTVDRDARPVTIYAFEVIDFRPGVVAEADVRVSCSKGTYIRSLAEDLGQDFGLGGHVASLRRTCAGGFVEKQCHTLEELEEERGEGRAEELDHHLLPIDAPLSDLPALELDSDTSFYFTQGQPVMDMRVYRLGDEGDTVRVFRDNGDFLGVGVITDDGRVSPKRLVVLAD
ncbi:tRNA pseudouridine(55) synthase TruB [Teredinibacter sp. KSP-S5-2]|uniref:tRNA pseudouridine(55) synthase TruB n=1 Tax=Teredinibacter sp. KSP-S5-2 TaxID=3034506 RepID=UPI0029349E8B|nr:tRNA pseudouridine(55) synthase TruB [Teredinibacter sp. KSP-S5-2]WNO08211.1 tRNA pseudouridine(55) synthase TruB [Teredinibacter sp. KSP-S5-2]